MPDSRVDVVALLSGACPGFPSRGGRIRRALRSSCDVRRRERGRLGERHSWVVAANA